MRLIVDINIYDAAALSNIKRRRARPWPSILSSNSCQLLTYATMSIIPDGVYSITKPNNQAAGVVVASAPPDPNSLVFVLPLTPDDELKVSTLGPEQPPSLNQFLFCISGSSRMSATGTLPLRTLLPDASLAIRESLRRESPASRPRRS